MPKLTKRLIDSLKPTASDRIVWDDDLRGFGLKIAPSGRKTFILKYRTLENRQRKPNVGVYGDLTVEQARKKAKAMKVAIAEGADPAAEKSSRRHQITLNQFADLYFQSAKKKESTLGMERCYYDAHVRRSIGKRGIDSINESDLQRWLNSLSDQPGAANRTASLLSAMFNDAERKQYRQSASNPCRSLKKYPSKLRERYLSRDELQRLTDVLKQIASDKSVNPVVVPFIQLALLTGARKQELLTMKWSYIDVDRRVVQLPDSKTGARNLYLSPQAVDVLQAIPRQKGNPYVFVGERENDHFHNIRKPFKRVCELAEIENFRIHDLRHTHASWGVRAGLSTHVLAKTLGHSQSRTTERYAHVDDEPALLAADAVSRAMFGNQAGASATALPHDEE